MISSSSSPEPSVYPEIAWYAEEFGISLDEAIRRTTIMVELDVTSLREAVGDRWGGGWLEHEPEFRFVVRLTGTDADEFEAIAKELPLPVYFITGVPFSESDALAAMERMDDVLHAELPNMGFGWEPMTGAIVMNGPEAPTAELLRELQALAGDVPVLYEYSPAMELQGG